MTLTKLTTPVVLLLILAGCGTEGESGEPTDKPETESLAARAAALAQETIIIDSHVDVPYRLVEQMEDISVRTEGGDFDYPRAIAGGLNAPFMSIYVPSDKETDGAYELAEELIDMVVAFETEWPEKFAIARSVADVREQFERGVISLPLGMENGAPIEGDLEKLRHFADRGVRYITLTHAENNHICDSSYAEEKQWGGLSPFGRELIAEMNRLGVMIDVSHISDDSFEQVMALSSAPVIASHSSCRHFTPGFERNMSDEMIVELAANGGVLQINFGSAFLSAQVNAQSREFFAARGAFVEEHRLEQGAAEVDAFEESWFAEHPRSYAELADVADHIDHVVELVGIEHVGIGSDFDGVGDSLPTGLKDVSQYPNLIAELLERGYSAADVRKILSGNLIRVWSAVEKLAAEATGDDA